MSVAEKKTAKKGKLIDAAFELFTKKGINPTAIDEVVKRAGVAKGTFYLYFKDKYDLLEQIIVLKCADFIQNILEDINEKLSDTQTAPSEKIILFVDKIIDYFIENKNLAILVLSDMAAFRKLWMKEKAKSENEIYRVLTDIFIEGGCDEETAPKQMYMMFIAIASICCDSILYQTPYTPEEIRPQIHLMIKSLLR